MAKGLTTNQQSAFAKGLNEIKETSNSVKDSNYDRQSLLANIRERINQTKPAEGLSPSIDSLTPIGATSKNLAGGTGGLPALE